MATNETGDTEDTPHNRIHKIETLAAGTTANLRVFTITGKDGISTVCSFPVPHGHDPTLVDIAFLALKSRVDTYESLRDGCTLLLQMLEFGLSLPRLRDNERAMVTPLAALIASARNRINQASQVQPATTDPVQVHRKKQYVEEAITHFNQAATTLIDFITNPRLCTEVIITGHRRDKIVQGVHAVSVVVGSTGMMFDKNLFI